jgi:hypothetical protein
MNDDPTIRLIQRKGHLRCANGSPLKIIGYTYFKLNIGTNNIPMKYTVVENLFPKIIIGLRYMKKENINVIPSKDGLMVKGMFIPFISKIDAEN